MSGTFGIRLENAELTEGGDSWTIAMYEEMIIETDEMHDGTFVFRYEWTEMPDEEEHDYEITVCEGMPLDTCIRSLHNKLVVYESTKKLYNKNEVGRSTGFKIVDMWFDFRTFRTCPESNVILKYLAELKTKGYWVETGAWIMTEEELELLDKKIHDKMPDLSRALGTPRGGDRKITKEELKEAHKIAGACDVVIGIIDTSGTKIGLRKDLAPPKGKDFDSTRKEYRVLKSRDKLTEPPSRIMTKEEFDRGYEKFKGKLDKDKIEIVRAKFKRDTERSEIESEYEWDR